MLNCFSFHLISSHRSFSWKLLTSSHCHRSLCHPISSQLISCLLSFSPHLSSSQLMSSYLSLFEVHFLRNQLAHFWYFMVVHLMSKHLIYHQFFLHLPFNLFPKPNKAPQQLFPCRRHEKFRVVVSAVSDPCARWDTHSKPSRREAPTQKGFYTAKLLHTASFHTENPLHTEAFTHCKLLDTASFYTEKLLHKVREAFIHRKLLHRANFYTEKPLHREALTHRSFYTEKLLHTANFYTQKLYIQPAFTDRSFYAEKPFHGEAFTQRRFCTQHAFKLRKSANNTIAALMQPLQCDLYDVQLQKTMVLRTQPRRQATSKQPLQCNLQRLSRKAQ